MDGRSQEGNLCGDMYFSFGQRVVRPKSFQLLLRILGYQGQEPCQTPAPQPIIARTDSLHPPALGGVSVMTNGNYRFVRSFLGSRRLPTHEPIAWERWWWILSVKPAQFGPSSFTKLPGAHLSFVLLPLEALTVLTASCLACTVDMPRFAGS